MTADHGVTSEQLSSLLAGQKRALELAATGSPLAEVLDALARVIETHSGGALVASVLVIDADSQRLTHAAAPSLPADFIAEVDGIANAPTVEASTVTALFSRRTVVVSDPVSDPAWKALRKAGLAHGWRACWSTPVCSSSGDFLATFVIYRREPYPPSEAEQELIDLLAHTAAIVIEGDQERRKRKTAEAALRDKEDRVHVERVRSQQELLASTTRYRLIGEAANDAIWDWDLVTNEVVWSPGLHTHYGFTPEQVHGEARWWVEHIHPDDRQRITERIDRVGEGDEIWSEEYRFKRHDGSYANVLDRGRLVRDACGHPVRMVGAMLDLTDRKRTQARDHLLVLLDDAVRPLVDPDEVAAITTRMLQSHLEVDRCVYADWPLPTAAGAGGQGINSAAAIRDRREIERLGDRCASLLNSGQPFVVEDRLTDPRISAEEQAEDELTGIRSLLCVPVCRGGRSVGALMLQARTARAWRPDEIEVTQQFAARCWESTERARLTRRLHEGEVRFRELANSIPNLAWIARPDGSIHWFNEQWFTYTGTTPAESEGWGWQSVHDPEVLPEVTERWMHSVDTGTPFEMVFPLRGADGRCRRFLTRVNPVRNADGDVLQWVGTNTDVEDERRATETNALLRAAIEFANDSVLITEPGLEPPGPRIEYVNRAFTELTGYRPEEIIGRTPRILQGQQTDREPLDRLRGDLAKYQSFHGETVNYRKDGDPYVVEWRITPLKDETGQVIKWVSVQRDVTDRRVAEEQREALLEAERTARTEAERLGRMKDEFLATLSHELRTPLNAILGWSQILAMGQADTRSVQEGAAVISRNARAQAQVIEDLLDMSRIISGKVRLDVQLLNLAEVVAAAVETVQPTADAKKIRVATVFDSHACFISADTGRLQQIIWNLLSNALKFTPSHGRVQVVLERVASHVELSVRDTGQGIAAEFLPHVFERFRQADSSTTRQVTGLGLGLSIVKQLTELHGGSVRAESAGKGTGSVFVLSFPLAPLRAHDAAASALAHASSAAGAAVPSVSAESGVLQHVKVLVVDDDRDSRDLIAKLLHASGADVVTAESASAALALLQQEPFGLLVSDIGMPGQDGYSLIRDVRSMPDRYSRVAAVALTAFARSEDRRRALLAGYDSYLAKPVEPAELLTACATLVQRTDGRTA